MPATAPTGAELPKDAPHPVAAWPSPDGMAPPVEEPPRRSIPLGRCVAMVVVAVTLFSLSDVAAKRLSEGLPPVQIVWIRYVLLFGIALLLFARRRQTLRPARPASQLMRGVMLLGAAMFFIIGLGRLGVAEATAISFATPAIITVLAIPVLGEAVGIRRWTAIGIGLAGILLVVRPGADAFQAAALFPLGSALCGAVMAVLTRRIGAVDPPETTLFWSAAFGLGVLTIASPLWWTGMGRDLAGPALLMGGLYAVGQYLLIVAYSKGPASMLAPFSYAQVLVATALSAAVFDELPDGLSLAGIGLVVASGAYTLYREGVLPGWRRWPAAFAAKAQRKASSARSAP